MTNKSLLKNAAISALLMAVASGVANAIPIVDIVDPDLDIEVSASSPEYTFIHDLTDGIWPDLFIPALDTIDSATISINLSDDGGAETIEITIGALTPTIIDNIGSSRNYTAVIPSLFDLQLNGMLTVLLSTIDRPSGVGDFFFVNSTLTTQVTKFDPSNFPGVRVEGQVAEPATLALFSLGLAGLGFARRKIKT